MKRAKKLHLIFLSSYPVLKKFTTLMAAVLPGIAACAQHDTTYYRDFKQPYSVKLSLEKTGAGVEFSPDNSISLFSPKTSISPL